MGCIKRSGFGLVSLITLMGCGADERLPPQAGARPGSAGAGGGGVLPVELDGAVGVASRDSGGEASATVSPDPPRPSPYEDDLVFVKRYTTEMGGGGPSFVEITDVEVSGDHVYVCTATQGLLVVERSSLNIVAARIPSKGSNRCQHVATFNERVAIANRGDEYSPIPHVTLYDATDPSNPIELAAVTSTTDSFEGLVAVDGATFAVALHDRGVAILRYDGVGNIAEIGRATGLSNAWDLALDGSTLYVADGADGVRVVDLQTPTAPTLVGHAPISGSTKHVEIGDGVLFASSGSEGVFVLDRSTPSRLTTLSRIDTPGSALMSGYSDGYLHVADWNDVRVFDVSDPASPIKVATENIATGGFSRVLAVDAEGNRSYIGEWTGLFDYELFPLRRSPDVRVPSFAITFPKTGAGGEAAFSLVIENEGDEVLEIASIEVISGGDLFEPLVNRVSIPPGERDFVEVRFRPTDDIQATGELVLLSDDPDEGRLSLGLIGNPPQLFVGDPFPDITWPAIQGGDASGEIRSAGLLGSVVLLSYFATF